jgi:hypothetical protein
MTFNPKKQIRLHQLFLLKHPLPPSMGTNAICRIRSDVGRQRPPLRGIKGVRRFGVADPRLKRASKPFFCVPFGCLTFSADPKYQCFYGVTLQIVGYNVLVKPVVKQLIFTDRNLFTFRFLPFFSQLCRQNGSI